MKILQINKYLYPKGGSEIYMFQLSKLLNQAGHEVKYWGMKNDQNIVNDFYELNIPFIDYQNQNSLDKINSVLKTVYSFENKKRINKVLDLFQPDIVHLHNYNFQITPSILPEIKKRGIKIVQTVHDGQMVCPNHRFYNPTLQSVCTACSEGTFFNSVKYKCFDASFFKSVVGYTESMLYHQSHFYEKYIDIILSPSPFLANLLRKRIKNEIRIIPNFAAIDFIPNTNPANNYHLYYGRISEDKGVFELIEIYKRTKIPLKIIGTGLIVDELKTKIKNFPHIEYLGAKYGNELFNYVYHAKFIVQLAKSYENCPLTVVEAYALGKPVIVAKHSGFVDIVTEGKTGFFIDNIYDIQTNVQKIEKLNEVDVNEMTNNIKDFYQTNMSRDLHLNQVLNIYNELLAETK